MNVRVYVSIMMRNKVIAKALCALRCVGDRHCGCFLCDIRLYTMCDIRLYVQQNRIT